MRYTDVVFDLYGTLVDIHTEENSFVWDKTALFFNFYGAPYTGAELEADFRALISRREIEAGQNYECFPDVPFESVMADLFRAKGITHEADGLGFHAAQVFRIVSIEYLRLYPHAREALGALRDAGCRLWLLSNAQRAFTAYELRALGLNGTFDGTYLSSDYGCRKPDPRFFGALLDERALDPSRCLMVGNDRRTDIAGAVAAGMDTLYMHTALTPREQAPADPALHPDATTGGRHYEFEGDDWSVLSPILCRLVTGV